MEIYGLDNKSSEAMDGDDGQETVAKRQPCRLEYLGYCERDGVIDWLLSRSLIDISAVRTLSLTKIDGPTWQRTVTRLLRTLGASLEHLTLWGALPNFFYLLHMFMRDATQVTLTMTASTLAATRISSRCLCSTIPCSFACFPAS
jgi:hypothetical protein